MIPTLGDCSISETESRRQSAGTRVSESTIDVSDVCESTRDGRLLTQKNVVPNPDIAIRPSTAILLEDLFEASFIRLGFIGLSPVIRSLVVRKLFFNIARKHETVIHIRRLLGNVRYPMTT